MFSRSVEDPDSAALAQKPEGASAYCRHLPCCVTLDGSYSCVCDNDDFAHDGDYSDHFGFAVVDEAFEEGADDGVLVSCGHGGHEESALEACAPAPDGSAAPRGSAVARMRGAPGEAGGGAPDRCGRVRACALGGRGRSDVQRRGLR